MIFSAASALPSDLRMMAMISSRASKTFSNPSRMWMRFFSCSSSCSSRLVTTSSRKCRKCQSICLRSSRSGRPASAFSVGTRQVRLTAKLVCSGVCLNRYAMTIFSSASRFSSSAIRTSSVDRSLTSTRCGSLRDSDDVADPLDQHRLVHGVGDAGDVDRLLGAADRAGFPGGAQPDAAGAGAVDLLHLLGRVEDLAAGREIRPLHPAAQLRHRQIRVVEQLDERLAHLGEVVRRDVGGHPHRDAGGAVDEQVRDARRQHHRLGLGAVVVGPERHRLLVDLLQDLVRDAGQPALGIAHRRRRIAVERAEVARAVDQRIAQRERLRHADQRLVEGRVAVRVVAAHHVADHLGALAVLGVGGEVLLPHREQDAALHRLEAVAHVGQRARGDHRERVVQVAALRGVVQRHRAAAVARHCRCRTRHRPAAGAAGPAGASSGSRRRARVRVCAWPFSRRSRGRSRRRSRGSRGRG